MLMAAPQDDVRDSFTARSMGVRSPGRSRNYWFLLSLSRFDPERIIIIVAVGWKRPYDRVAAEEFSMIGASYHVLSD